jgi:hypothetical protein
VKALAKLFHLLSIQMALFFQDQGNNSIERAFCCALEERWSDIVMTIATSSPFSDASRRVLQLQIVTLLWMSAEVVISLLTAWHSRSPALFAFGGDSLIELFLQR